MITLKKGASRAALSLVLALAGLSGGCALTSKADPLEVSYLRPSPVPVGAAGRGKPLRLEPVEAGEALGRSLLVTEEGVLHQDEELQWTEVPALYLERALGRTLFEAAAGKLAGYRRDLSPETPRLVVELLRFEWARGGKLTLECRIVLWKDDRTVLERTLTSSGSAASPSDLGRGSGSALANLALQVRKALPK